MKIFTFSFKSLLIAAGLMLGSANAWADGNKRILDSQNYESALTTDWTGPNVTATLVSGDATYGTYAKGLPSGTGNRSYYKSISFASTPGSGYTTSSVNVAGYVIEFDMLMSGGNTKDRSVSQFIVPTTGPNLATNATYTGTDYIFSLSQPQRDAASRVTGWYINDLTNATDKTVTIAYSTWYHYKLVVSATSVEYTISHGATQDATGSKTVTSLPSITGFFALLGRGSGEVRFDNMEIYDYVEDIVVTAPTFSFKKVDGIKRVYTLSNPNGAGTLYYTTSPAGEAPAKGDAAYTSTASTSLDVEYSETGTYYAYVLHSGGSATSSVTSQEVVAGAVTLNAPVFKVEDMVLAEDGFYYPKVSFSSNNSGLPGSPTATFDVVNPYTFTSTGYIDVTASAEGYTSSTSRFTVSSKYYNSNTIDLGALEISDFDAGTWTFGTGVPRDYWTNRAAKIPADVDKCYLTNTSATYGDPDNSAVVEGITISNYNQRAPEFCIGYGMYTPYSAISGNTNYMNFTVNDATAEDYAVYNGWNDYGSGTFNTVQAGNATFGLYRYDTMLRTIKVYSPAPSTVSVTVTSAGWATLYTDYALNFAGTGLTAYTATVDGETVTLTEVSNVQAGTGVVLKGDADTYNIPVIASSETAKGDLRGNATEATAYDAIANTTLYILVKNDEGDAQFFPTNAGSIEAGKAYLPVANSSAKALRVVVNGQASDVTAPAVVETEEPEILFNMAGVQVDKNFKGFVVNQKGEKRFNR